MLNRGLLLLVIPVQAINLALASQFLGQFAPPSVTTAWQQGPCTGAVESIEAAPYESVTIGPDGIRIELSADAEDEHTHWPEDEE